MSASLPAENLYLDLSARAKLRLTGADRVRFLNGQVSNDMRRVSDDVSIYTGVMTIKGKLCADAFVHAAGDSLLMDAEPELRDSLLPRLERYVIADDVQIDDATEDFGLLHLLIFADAPDTALPDPLATLGPDVQAVRSWRYGREGLDLFYPAGQSAEVRASIHAAGFTLLNDDGLESLRITAGVPRWGAELTPDTMPAEAGIEERAVSFAKGCYIGQEVVSRVKSVGHANRLLCGLRALDASPLYPGMKLLPDTAATDAPAADATAGTPAPARPVGEITSAAPAAGHGGAHYLALALVRRTSATPGTRLLALVPADPADASASVPPCPVEICALPFA